MCFCLDIDQKIPPDLGPKLSIIETKLFFKAVILALIHLYSKCILSFFKELLAKVDCQKVVQPLIYFL